MIYGAAIGEVFALSLWTGCSQYVRERRHPWSSAVHGDAESDIDLLIIRPRLSTAEETRWAAQLGELEAHAFMWTGNEINIVDYDAQDVARLWRHRDRFLLRQAGPLGRQAVEPFLRG